jgi:hypothetical protein
MGNVASGRRGAFLHDLRQRFAHGETGWVTSQPQRRLRLVATALLAFVLGAGGVAFFASVVRAENLGILELFRFDRQQREAARQIRIAPPAQAPVHRAKLAHRKAPKTTAPRQTLKAMATGSHTECVRLCDGYHFPLGPIKASADPGQFDRICRSMCPAAPVRAFSVPKGAEIDKASAGDGSTYRDLPMAFSYRKAFDPACSCHGPAGAPRVSFLADPTLQPGDIITTRDSAQAFTGTTKRARSAADFKDFRKTRMVSARTRRAVDDKLGVTQREVAQAELAKRFRIVEAPAEPDMPIVTTPIVVASSMPAFEEPSLDTAAVGAVDEGVSVVDMSQPVDRVTITLPAPRTTASPGRAMAAQPDPAPRERRVAQARGFEVLDASSAVETITVVVPAR